MASITEETQTFAAPARGARGPSSGSVGTTSASGSAVLTPEQLQLIGETIGSRTHWQADVSRQTGYSKYSMTRFLNNSRKISPMLGQLLHKVMVLKIDQMVDLFSIDGLPGATDARTAHAKRLICEGLAILNEVQADFTEELDLREGFAEFEDAY